MKIRLPRHGASRVVTRFVLFPVKLDGYMYWFQFIKIYQVYDTISNKWVNKSVFSERI